MALTKASLAEILVSKYRFNKKIAKEYVDAFFDEVIQGIIKEGVVKLSGFGKFTTRDKASRPGRNPKTGEYVKISARRVVTFRAGQKLKGFVEDYLDPNAFDLLDD